MFTNNYNTNGTYGGHTIKKQMNNTSQPGHTLVRQMDGNLFRNRSFTTFFAFRTTVLIEIIFIFRNLTIQWFAQALGSLSFGIYFIQYRYDRLKMSIINQLTLKLRTFLHHSCATSFVRYTNTSSRDSNQNVQM